MEILTAINLQLFNKIMPKVSGFTMPRDIGRKNNQFSENALGFESIDFSSGPNRLDRFLFIDFRFR